MIVRLRLNPPQYDVAYDHTSWSDHVDRVRRLGDLAVELNPVSAADLAAGDGAILDRLGCHKVYGDIVDHAGWTVGPIEETVEHVDPVDLFICTEVLEHVTAPFELLVAIRAKAERLLLSTPIDNDNDPNTEHLWSWSFLDVSRMLRLAGWKLDRFEKLDYRPRGGYLTGVWVAS